MREVAAAWRDGLGALLAGPIGFGLVRARSDIGQLAPGRSAAAGVLLVAALAVGAVGAFCLLRAAHGHPCARRLSASDSAAGRPLEVEDHDEALASARVLRTGVTLTCLRTVLLVTAVGVTWYAPPKDPPRLLVRQGATTLCGEVVSTEPCLAQPPGADPRSEVRGGGTARALDQPPGVPPSDPRVRR